MKTVAECLGENLKRLRRERDLTQGEFARKAGVSMSFLQNLEKGKKWIGPKTVATLAQALGVNEAELFRDCAEPAALDPKQILLLMGRALGVALTQESLCGVEVRATPTPHFMLYELMPESVCAELSERCREPGWDWEEFLQKLRARD